jgi:endoglucanase
MRKWIVSVAAALSVSLLPGSVLAQDTPLPPVGWAPEGSPVAKYGRLKVVGAKVQSSITNTDVQLRGMSFGWTSDQTAESRPADYYNERVVAWLAADWKVSIVRAAMGVSDKNGTQPILPPGTPYKGNESWHKGVVQTLVNAAIWQGIYVIIDWHSHGADQTHNGFNEPQAAKEFFAEMAGIYKDYPNVLYEIYNEPLDVSWDNIKAYANGVIPVIRAVDANNIIIVGTRFYSQKINEPSSSPVSGTNIVYTAHFYCDHSDGGNIPFTSTTNIPIFVSEFGISRSNGNNTCSQYNNGISNGYPETTTWLDKLDARKVSWVNWQVNNRDESSSILKMYSSATERLRLHRGKWTDNDLTDRGKWMRAKLRSYADAPNPTYKIDIVKEGEGTISGNSNISVCDEVTLKATPASGWRFEGWILNGMSNRNSEYRVEVCYNKTGKAVFFPDNLISNSTFTSDGGNWAKYPSSGANVPSMATVNEELVVTPSSAGSTPDAVRVEHTNTSLATGKRYRLSFDARATQARTIQAVCRIRSGLDVNEINIGEPVSLTTTKAPYTREFNMSAATTTAGTIAFYLGGQTAGVVLDNVELKEIGQATGVQFQNSAVSARPFKASFNGRALVLTGGGRTANVTVYDMAGRVRLARSVSLSNAAVSLPLDRLPSGIYSVRYDVDGKAAQDVGRIMLAK